VAGFSPAARKNTVLPANEQPSIGATSSRCCASFHVARVLAVRRPLRRQPRHEQCAGDEGLSQAPTLD